MANLICTDILKIVYKNHGLVFGLFARDVILPQRVNMKVIDRHTVDIWCPLDKHVNNIFKALKEQKSFTVNKIFLPYMKLYSPEPDTYEILKGQERVAILNFVITIQRPPTNDFLFSNIFFSKHGYCCSDDSMLFYDELQDYITNKVATMKPTCLSLLYHDPLFSSYLKTEYFDLGWTILDPTGTPIKNFQELINFIGTINEPAPVVIKHYGNDRERAIDYLKHRTCLTEVDLEFESKINYCLNECENFTM